jgi:hypothetical protein
VYVAEQVVPLLMVQMAPGVKTPEPRRPGEKSISSPTMEPELPETMAVQSVLLTTVTGLGVQDKDVEVVAGAVAATTVREKVPELSALIASPS